MTEKDDFCLLSSYALGQGHLFRLIRGINHLSKFRRLFPLVLLLFAVSGYSQSGWTNRSSRDVTGDLVAVYFTSASNGWVAGDHGFLASTTDGGNSWVKYPLNTSEDINEIYFRNDKNGYLVAGKKLFLTTDGGRTWQETRIYLSSDFKNGSPEFLSVRFTDKKRGIIVGAVINKDDRVIDSLIMRTEDGGETWQRVIVSPKTELLHVHYSHGSNVWAVGDNGVILASTDGGGTWRTQSSGTSVPLYSVDFHDNNEGYAVGKSGMILKTENGGSTWNKVITNFKDTFMRVDFTNDKNGWIVGYSGTIIRSSDRGQTWVLQESGTSSKLYGLFMNKKFGWAVGEKGAILSFKK